MFYVYVLQNGNNRYIGYTENLQKRVSEHNAGRNFSTKTPRDWTLVYYEAHLSAEIAKRREYYFKHSSGRRMLGKILTK